MKSLCSRCGSHYREWKNQDIEGNLCPRCTVSVLRVKVKEYHTSIDLLCDNLTDENSNMLRHFPFIKQRIIVEEAFKEGILIWKI